MKIIDLLNKIAEGEKTRGIINVKDWDLEKQPNIPNLINTNIDELNKEIEIESFHNIELFNNSNKIEPIVKKNLTRNQKQLANKLNEVIEVLNGLNRS